MTGRHTHAAWCWCMRHGESRGVAARLGALGWGAFFIWIGIALLIDVGWGPALLGVGLITLGGQAARWIYRLELEGFWLLVGAGFLLGGIWRMVDVSLPLMPVLIVLAGLALVFTAVLSRRPSDEP
jgi:hypothetical protein